MPLIYFIKQNRMQSKAYELGNLISLKKAIDLNGFIALFFFVSVFIQMIHYIFNQLVS